MAQYLDKQWTRVGKVKGWEVVSWQPLNLVCNNSSSWAAETTFLTYYQSADSSAMMHVFAYRYRDMKRDILNRNAKILTI